MRRRVRLLAAKRRRRSGFPDTLQAEATMIGGGFARRFQSRTASNRHAGESRHPDCILVALLLDSGFRRNDESKAASELSGKDIGGE
jgi:hypothetical protein